MVKQGRMCLEKGSNPQSHRTTCDANSGGLDCFEPMNGHDPDTTAPESATNGWQQIEHGLAH